MADTTTEWVIFYEWYMKEGRMVSHIFVEAETEEAALELGRKKVPAKGTVFRADPGVQWSVQPKENSVK